MASTVDQQLSRRERQILDILFRQEQATVAEIVDQLPKAPTRTAVRTLLRILESKGHVRHERQGRRNVYSPTLSRAKAARSALEHVLRTFFDGSMGAAVATHIADPTTRLDPDEVTQLQRLIDDAKDATSQADEDRSAAANDEEDTP